MVMLSQAFGEEVGKSERRNKDSFDTLVSSKVLGCTIGRETTAFRLFAPRAVSVSLVLFERYDATAGAEHAMSQTPDGVWEIELSGNLRGRYYGYRISGPSGPGEMFDPSVVVADPYSRAVCTQNHWRHPAKSLILDSSYDWQGDTWVAPADQRRLIIYEAHLRDATMHPSSGAKSAGTYLGMVEKGRRGGLAYLKDLGINAVEFLPLHEFANIELPYGDSVVQKFGYPVNSWNPYERNHWGYMTGYFFAPESYYASDGTMDRGRFCGADGRAVREMKDMVKALHREGISVILDVVYNHVSDYDQSPLKFIDKMYYFRTTPDGKFLGSSGCGNDLATERPMARRLIIDSVKHWMTEYHIDGFRFDQAAMIDEKTLAQVALESRKINPRVILIAEPWGGGKYKPASMSDLGWSSWNDLIRNGVKGRNPRGPIPDDGPGFIFGRREGKNTKKSVMSFVTGTLRSDKGLFTKPQHAVNYLESHDDNTMGDYVRKVTGTVRPGQKIDDVLGHVKLTPRQQAISKLGAAFLLTAQGPVMIHQGQEFARTKVIPRTRVPDRRAGEVDDNSFEKDDATNWIDYEHVSVNRDLFDYYRGLITLRRTYPVFGGASRSAVHFIDARDEFAIAFRLDGDGGDRFLVVLNGNPCRRLEVDLPEGRWDVLADAKSASPGNPLGFVEKKVTVPRTSALILKFHP